VGTTAGPRSRHLGPSLVISYHGPGTASCLGPKRNCRRWLTGRSKTDGDGESLSGFSTRPASLHVKVKHTLACIASSASGAGSLERDQVTSTGKKAEQNDRRWARTDARNGDAGGRWSLFCATNSLRFSVCPLCTAARSPACVSPSTPWPDPAARRSYGCMHHGHTTHLFEQTNNPELLIKWSNKFF
jgi:hypothetical protein